MKVICYIGTKTESGLENVRNIEELTAEERQNVSRAIQIQCATAVGYQECKKKAAS